MKDYDPGKESNNIMYLDVNNHYRWAMSQPLLSGKLKWVDSEELDLKPPFIHPYPSLNKPAYVGM